MPSLPSVRLAALVTGALVAVVALLVGGLWTFQQGRTLPNTTIVGIDVSRMAPEEVRDAVSETVAEREDEPIVLTFQDTTFELEPAEVDYEADLDRTVETALARGREGGVSDVAARVRSLFEGRDIALVESWDQQQLTAWVEETADEIDRDESVGSVDADPDTLEVEVELPAGSAEVDRDRLQADVLDALRHTGPRDIEVPAETTDQPLPDDEVEAIADQVREAVAEPLELTVGDLSLTLEGERLAQLISVGLDDDEEALELVVSEDAVEEHLAEDAAEVFDRSSRPARYEVPRSPPERLDAQGDVSFSPVEAPATIEPGRTGRSFDVELAAAQLTELVRGAEREAELDIETTQPEISTQDEENLAPTHLLGTFTTYYQAGEDRNQNIQRLADVIDGTQILPGEQFSINDISGERSCSKGYVPAGTIIDGELEDTCGGGTSQFGTTTFNAAFFSGFQLDEWKAHSWYISRYPQGREATLSFPYLDVRFTNTSDGVAVVRTTHDSTSVTVSVYGQPVADTVSASHGSPYDEREHEEETRTDSDLSSGQEEVLQPGGDGFTIDVTRTIEGADSSNSQEITTVYDPQTRIVERGE